jgi:ferredoxin
MNMRNGFDRQLAYINSRPRSVDQPPESERLAVAISPQTGSGALQIAERLAEYLQARAPHAEPPWRVFDRNLMAKVLEDHHHPTRLVEFLPEDAHNPVDDMLHELLGLHPPSWVIVQQSIETILNLVRAGNVILMGWGVNAVTRKLPNVFHVRLVGSLEHRVARIQTREHLSRQDALLFIRRRDGGARSLPEKALPPGGCGCAAIRSDHQHRSFFGRPSGSPDWRCSYGTAPGNQRGRSDSVRERNSYLTIRMAHIVTSRCQGCKFTDCVEVCPVACFYELENQLVIHPEECIDCTACVSECPVEAIYADADVPAQYQSDIEFNAAQSKRLKEAGQDAIVATKQPLATAAQKKAALGY